jgi:hypothetical protein
MGTFQHHAIIVSTWSPGRAVEAHAEASRIFPWVSPLSPPTDPNGYVSFFVPPDGSKERWPESKDGDKRRAEFIAGLRAVPESPFRWVEVTFGERGARVERTDEEDEECE